MQGLVNNVVYVIFLSAAEDILKKHAAIPKSTVLLANILPCLAVKLIAPYLVRTVSYTTMVFSALCLAVSALTTVAWLDAIELKFLGVVFASASSGLGETCFLALTSHYASDVVVAWSSGTGAAGLVGALYYLVMCTVLRLSMRLSLTIALLLPAAMGAAYLFLLEAPPAPKAAELLEDAPAPVPAPATYAQLIAPLLLPYVLPLFLVALAEYTINQSVFFALLYPLEETPFAEYGSHYVTYQAVYQAGIFVGRTFGRSAAVGSIWPFAALQWAVLAVLASETVAPLLLPTIYPVFGLVLLEGLVGGAAYVNTFCDITASVPKAHADFSMAFAGVSVSLGITVAGFGCLVLEPVLCASNRICRAVRASPPSI